MLPFRSGRPFSLGAAGFLLTLGILCYAALAAEPESSPKPTKSPPSLTSIPLPIGQEAKGLVLPDFNTEGHLRARFEAGTAKRVDAEHIQFKSLKMTTFTELNSTDMQIEMPVSTLDLNTRILTSHERTTVKRADFHIAGDSMNFDTVSRKGTLTGNVKMVITDQSDLRKKTAE